MPRIDLANVPERKGTGYPAEFAVPCAERVRQRLGDAGGLADFGVNLMRLPPGNWSSQRHWHSDEDEFVYVLAGEVVLVEDGGETGCAPAIAQRFRKTPATGII
ncbi:putative cupin superfamily protein [Bradyrhizobium elkanii]|uniref:Cupin superfamily protein n=1 Tax=Bradyrhizobium elkanii TaxID=29448 RepID=A0A8I1Y7Z6_BRAEL|nr:putative cupin superfamily protein [Bradyrhizobium elkanii]MCP1749621.1 putative cupin superfamily protein [Bradyrhizobium elkanii]MCP1984193.1 putative cupin superfamily protein [Bradyrhizobium elkanii]MCS3890085.1 putative cupin superfamily protein [Bradyrhizobium elkanii]MCS4210893.1 putative cupin superfamily protein [Bradyrhizobium elkanii]